MRKTKGFTLIELMIVVAIIAIIAAIAIPNLLQARIRANEASAMSQARNYLQAQSLFRERRSGAVAANRGGATPTANGTGYAQDYRFLFYGSPVVATSLTDATDKRDTTNVLRLISQPHADASIDVGSIGGHATIKSPAIPVVFNGYWFDEPVDAVNAAGAAPFFDTNFAHIAAPDNSSRTGSRVFFVDDNGTVLSRPLPANSLKAANAGVNTPLTIGTAGWTLN